VVKLIETCEEKNYSSGAHILEKGSQDKFVFFIITGTVKIVLEIAEKHCEIELNTLEEGEFFGEMALLENTCRSATVKATQDCTVLKVEGEEFREIISKHADIKFKILSRLSKRVRNANNKIVGLQAGNLYDYFYDFNIELNTLQAAREASLIVFEQINSRATEVISSAARNHQYTKYVLSICTVLCTIIIAGFSWLGIKEYSDIRSIIDNAKGDIEKQTQEIDLLMEKINNDAKIVTQYKEKIKTIPDLQKAVNTQTLQDFYTALDTNINKAEIFYKNLPENEISVALNQLEEKAILQHKKPEDYTSLFYSILEHTKSVKNKARLYYLLLSHAVLIEKWNFKSQSFDDVFEQFQDFVDSNNNKRIKLDIADIVQVFSNQPDSQQIYFKQINDVIPSAWRASSPQTLKAD